jgi:hypothetical protein
MVPYLDQTLWFVPSNQFVAQLMNDGVTRGRIWTAGELQNLVSIPSIPRGDLQRIVRLKSAFGAQVVEVKSDFDRPTDGSDVDI